MKRIDVVDDVVTMVWNYGTYSDIPATSFEVDAAVDVHGGYISNGDGTFTVPGKDLAEEKQNSLDAIQVEHAKKLNDLTGNKSVSEKLTWKLQQDNAEKFLAGDETKRAFLEGQVTASKKSELALTSADVANWKANDIMIKVARTETLVEFAAGMKNEADEAINAVTTHAELVTTITALHAAEDAAMIAFMAAIST